MFTGIIEKVGAIQSLKTSGTDTEIWIDTGFDDLKLGESVALNGVCLTVAELDGDRAKFYISPETLRRTGFEGAQPGFVVNLERAMPANGRLSGHWVQGHVDTVAKLIRVEKEAESFVIAIEVSRPWDRYMVEKGSITLDGVSLTINQLIPNGNGSPAGSTVSINLIPHTWENTHFSHLVVPTRVNIEVDILAKYVERLFSYKETSY